MQIPENPHIFTINGPKNVTAKFVQTLSVTVDTDKTKGSVSSGETPANIHCDDQADSVCTHTYYWDASVALTATPKAGYQFVGWKENDQIISTEKALPPFLVEVTRNLVAVFEAKSFQCTAENFDVTVGDECVLYVRSETGIPYEACHGEAADCFEQAQAAGYATGSEPRESAIVVFDRVPGTALSVGHIGIVTGYNGDQISMHDSNWVGYHTIGDHTETVGQVGNADGGWPSTHLHFGILTDGSWVTTYRADGAYDWELVNHYTDPSELISNGFYSDDSVEFSIIVHPYECGGTFKLDGNSPDSDCQDNSSPTTVGNWTLQKDSANPNLYELGYRGMIYSKVADSSGTASWHPNLPKDGQYKVWVYIPDDDRYANSTNAVYTVSGNGTCYTPQSIDQSAVTDADRWMDIGTYDLYQYGSSTVSLQGDTDEENKSIAVDAVKFEYVGPIQQ